MTSSNQTKHGWVIKHLGLLNYKDALEQQKTYREDVINGSDHYLLLLQHLNVITLGRRTDQSHLLMSEGELKNNNIELFRVNRGGSATFHGPGQLVGYIICKSSRYGGIHKLVSNLLNLISDVIQNYNIDCYPDHNNPGVWTNTNPPKKLAAVGMSNSLGYTMHGFAINVNMKLTGFSAIVPCGLTLPVSTLSIESGRIIKVEDVMNEIESKFLSVFN